MNLRLCCRGFRALWVDDDAIEDRRIGLHFAVATDHAALGISEMVDEGQLTGDTTFVVKTAHDPAIQKVAENTIESGWVVVVTTSGTCNVAPARPPVPVPLKSTWHSVAFEVTVIVDASATSSKRV